MDVDALYQQHHAALLRYLGRYTGDRDQAADAAQEAYLRLVQRPPEREGNIRAWLFTVATNIVRDGWKRDVAAHRIPHASKTGLVGEQPLDPLAAVEREERSQLVRLMLKKLSAKERTILLMREEGFSHQEIAEAVGTTRKSIAPTIARARNKISGDLERLMEKLK